MTKEIGTGEVPQTLESAGRGIEDVRRAREEAAAVAATRNDSQRPAAPRSRRSNLGGAQLKLEVFNANIPGHHLFWENDVDARIERLLGEGFEFVTPEEVGMARMSNRVVADSDLSDRVSKYVGTTDDQKPMRAFLLKCPNDIWEDIQYCIADLTDARDRDILDAANRSDDRYQPKGFDTKIVSGRR